jgi:hypothetical protein
MLGFGVACSYCCGGPSKGYKKFTKCLCVRMRRKCTKRNSGVITPSVRIDTQVCVLRKTFPVRTHTLWLYAQNTECGIYKGKA